MRTDQRQAGMECDHQTLYIGRAKMTPVSPLPGRMTSRLIVLGNMAERKSPNLIDLESNKRQALICSMDYLVVGTGCHMDILLAAIHTLKEIHPTLKVVLADSKERPVLSKQAPPQGVHSVMSVSRDQAQTGRSLLFHQSGILAGTNAGLAAFIAFMLDAKLETRVNIAMAATNVCPELFGFSTESEPVQTSTSN